jgi:hypothetical protein
MGAAPQLTPTIESAKHRAKSQAGFEWVLAIQRKQLEPQVFFENK